MSTEIYQGTASGWESLLDGDVVPYTPEQTSGRFPGDPGVGNIMYGSSGSPGNRLFKPANQGGVQQGCGRMYYQPNQISSYHSAASAMINTYNAVPICSFKLPTSWSGVAEGSADAWLHNLASVTAQIPGPVWLCLHHEPRGDGTPADYRAMYSRAYPILKQAANVAIVPILNGWSFNAEDDPHQWVQDDSCDLIGVDRYPGDSSSTAELTTNLDMVFPVMSTWGKPIVLGEYGSRVSTQGVYAAQCMTDYYDYLLDRGDVVGMAYFNSGANTPGESWALSGDRLTAFTDIAGKSTSVNLGDL